MEPGPNNPFRIVLAFRLLHYLGLLKLPLADLAKIKGTNLLDVADVVSTGSEILQAGSVDELCERSLTTYLGALERSIQPHELPIGFKNLFSDTDKGWFPLLRVFFREELKANDKARIAFELDCQSLIPQMLGKSVLEVYQRLDKQDELLTATLNELRDFRLQLDEAVLQIVSLLDEINATVQSTYTLVREIHCKMETLTKLDAIVSGRPTRGKPIVFWWLNSSYRKGF